MENLILNSKLFPAPSGGPQYFTIVGPITYDNLAINGYRTCSITMTSPGYAQAYYDIFINVREKSSIYLKYTIRAIEAESIYFVAEFIDSLSELVGKFDEDITKEVNYDFRDVTYQFNIPPLATYVRFSIKFTGKITACTFFAPQAYYG